MREILIAIDLSRPAPQRVVFPTFSSGLAEPHTYGKFVARRFHSRLCGDPSLVAPSPVGPMCDCDGRPAFGSSNQNAAPPPIRESTPTFPPCASTRRFTVA